MKVFDLETNGLLPDLTKIHCLSHCEYDSDSAVELITKPKEIKEFCFDTLRSSRISGHNVLGFDLLAIKKIYPDFTWEMDNIVDTLVVSKFIYPNMYDVDAILRKVGKIKMPNTLVGRHSLESWGHRLGIHKGDYDGGWEEYNEEMGTYCIQDSVVTANLLSHLIGKNPIKEVSRLEHAIKRECIDIERNGFPMDRAGCVELYATLQDRKNVLHDSLLKSKPFFVKHGEEFTPKGHSERYGYTAGVPLTKVEFKEFNPNSDKQIVKFLTDLGWKPEVFTPSGQAKTSEEELEKITDIPDAKELIEHAIVSKRISQIATGKKGWLKVYNETTGKIHGGVDPMGTVTSRASHFNPNLGQVVSAKKPYGKECRTLFHANTGRVLVGSDLSGLELRMLGNRTARWDEGEYARTILEGDVHTANQKAAGLPDRDTAKTFIYALLYGAGDKKIGSIIGKGFKEGKAIRGKFFDNIPALGYLLTDVHRQAKRKYLDGLDGRRIPVRSVHSSLNALLQSDGAILAKRWVVLIMEAIRKEQLDANIIGWVHDEIILDVSREHSARAQEICVEQAIVSGEFYNMNVKIEATASEGQTWLDIH